ncbi:DinB family protein [Nonomuraea pusilla]|uniref:DinB superfamily protein n=1 Tax=Nonomuraea pusilla TaxID=46177 RepID=A0A1H7PF49_9ACTN|nr:DinB family protein [Nonomuraea pusilla]SEL33687.1 Protein of unknown function [Nonomuraea pusilla]
MDGNNEPVLREPPVAGDEADTLLGSLERQRRTLAWKCGGVDADGLRATVGASAVTLGGLLRHLALVEDEMFSQRLLGNDPAPPLTAPAGAGPGWEWRLTADDTPERLMALWEEAVARSRANVRQALEAGGLGGASAYTSSRGETPSLRRLLIDMVEEYARHVGHADLIRESVDGLVGEDPPW